MDKDILKQYIDACEAVKETEEQIRQLRKNRKTVVVDAVKGSMTSLLPRRALRLRASPTPYWRIRDSLTGRS